MMMSTCGRRSEAQRESESQTGGDMRFATEILLYSWYLLKDERFRFNYSGSKIIVNTRMNVVT